MRSLALLVAATLGCANADDPDSAGDASADSTTDTGVYDARLPDGSDAIFPTEDTGSTGICATPTGTTVTASGSYMSTPEMVIDAQLSTVWNSGDYTGSLHLKFPKPIKFDRVRIAGNALPDSAETFTFRSGSTDLGSATRNVTGENKYLPDIEIPVGTYDELIITIGMSASWIALAEIVVLDSTAGCP